MLNRFLILFGKLFISSSKKLNFGSGSTWPGHIALNVNKDFIKQTVDEKTKIVLVAGTNGKTTTSSLISKILEANGNNVVHNKSGANQLNGIASAIISGAKLFNDKLSSDYLILEVDENALPIALEEIKPNYVVCLNLFRDQLDRYGEIDSIIAKWKLSFEKLPKETKLILNADDPQVSFLGNKIKNKVLYFGLNENNQETIQHGADSTYCPDCLHDLDYDSISFSHLGNWKCNNCGLKRPSLDINKVNYYPLLGTYNKYNTLASVLFAELEKIDEEIITRALKNFKPAFGRQEEIVLDGKKIKLFLSKNPTSFNESLTTISSLNPKNLLIVLNDHPVDGTDVSWIWDTKLSDLKKIDSIVVSGDRVYDLALRLKYEIPKEFKISNLKFKIEEDLRRAVQLALDLTPKGQTLFVLPTYSAMLEVRKILKGRSIL